MTATISKKTGFAAIVFSEKKGKFSSIFVLFQNTQYWKESCHVRTTKHSNTPKKGFLKPNSLTHGK